MPDAWRARLRRHVFELSVHKERLLAPRRRPCLVMFPSNQRWDPASNLRAWLVGPELTRLGWRVITVPEPLSLAQRCRILALERPDVVWLQQTRHPLNEPRLYRPYPCVLDADDADYLDPRHTDRIARAATDAAAVVGGSRFVAACLGRHNPVAHVLWTTSPRVARPRVAPGLRAPIVAWAHGSPFSYPQEAEFVQGVLAAVARQRPFEFWLFGTTEVEANAWFAPLRALGVACRAVPPMGYDAYLSAVSQAAVGLQPLAPNSDFSAGKSFGKILAYLSGQVAIVASRAADHPLFFRHGESAFLPDDATEPWAEAIVRLLDDRTLRSDVADAAWRDFQRRLTTDVFARLLDPILRSVMRESGHSRSVRRQAETARPVPKRT